MGTHPGLQGATSILFICHGNICRSPMAQYVMQHLVDGAGRASDFAIDSAATTTEELGNPPHPGTRAVLAAHSIPCGKHRARLVTPQDGGRFDLVVIMDEENRSHLGRILHPGDLRKVRKLLSFTGIDRDVADPWYTRDFEATFQDVWTGCNALLEQLTGTQ